MNCIIMVSVHDYSHDGNSGPLSHHFLANLQEKDIAKSGSISQTSEKTHSMRTIIQWFQSS